MNKKTTITIGIIIILIGAIVLMIFVSKYNDTKLIKQAVESIPTITDYVAHYDSLERLDKELDNLRIGIIVGGIISAIGLIFLVIGLCLKKSDSLIQTSKSNSATNKLKELNDLYNEHLITEDEYKEKKKQILSDI